MADLSGAFGGGGFNAEDVEPSAPMEIMPPGKYLAQIIETEMATTSAGTGQMLKLTLEILDGPHARRKLWTNLNLVNPNATAVEIAQRNLSAICHAIGKMQVSDSEELHFKPLMVTVSVKPAGPDKQGIQRDAQNKVTGYSPASASGARPAPAVASRPAPAAVAAKPAASAAPPWRRTA